MISVYAFGILHTGDSCRQVHLTHKRFFSHQKENDMILGVAICIIHGVTFSLWSFNKLHKRSMQVP